ncbi:MAG: cation-translocating P-type ATPase [Lachnospiraceae bacterium]|nr:cation-translocating P-type ATPase [Lachnospiraceae bacterium]
MEKRGLTGSEAKERLKEFGYNKLKEEKEKSFAQLLLGQVLNPMTGILAAAVVLSVILKDYSEAAIIFFVICANAVIGAVQEKKAQGALEALKKLSVLKATVLRDGVVKNIDAEELVPGDIVYLAEGQEVPADMRLLETHNLKINETTLTGESVPVEKDAAKISDDKTAVADRLDRAYMSTSVTYGRGVGEVTETGMRTQMGKIAEMVSNEKEKPSPLQKAMADLSKWLGLACVAICAIIFVIGLIQKQPVADMLLTAVSLAVAAIPEGIVTIVTIVMALGVTRMAKLNAIVKNLPAVETLGSVTYVCSDKTGTLTQNKMTVVKAYCNSHFTDLSDLSERDRNRFLKGFVLCNDAALDGNNEVGDPTEIALLYFGVEHNLSQEEALSVHNRVNEWSFDSDRKLMTTIHKAERHKTISFTKGSTDVILSKCDRIIENGVIREITEDDKKKINDAMTQMSDDALRVLSLAVRYDDVVPTEENMIYVGMVGMIDPERKECVESIRVFHEAGVRTLMITGDHKNTAFAIAKKLGIVENIDQCIMGPEIDAMDDETLTERISNLRVFARVAPEHKVRIVKALQATGNVVSMTGDGTNDAPSLRAADVGVAMGITGTDVAKGAADIVLQDDKFTTIERAIREGRNIYANIRKSIIFAISSNLSEIVAISAAIFMGLSAPLRAMHLLWVNLLTDSLPCFALGVDPNSSKDVMKDKPRKSSEGVFANGGITIMAVFSILIALLTLGGFLFPAIRQMTGSGSGFSLKALREAYQVPGVLMLGQTYAFCILSLSELTYAAGMRDINTSIFKINWLDNKLMLGAMAFGLLVQIAVTEIPFFAKAFSLVSLSSTEWLCMIAVSLIPLLMHEIMVLVRRKR